MRGKISWKKALGWSLIGTPYVAVATFGVMTGGILMTVGAFVLTAFVVAVTYVGVSLT